MGCVTSVSFVIETLLGVICPCIRENNLHAFQCKLIFAAFIVQQSQEMLFLSQQFL